MFVASVFFVSESQMSFYFDICLLLYKHTLCNALAILLRSFIGLVVQD